MAEFDNLVMTETEAAKALRLGARTLQRLRLEGGGPIFIQLSDRRIGYAPQALERWLESRQRSSTADSTVNNAA